jgi:hypothetical protein
MRRIHAEIILSRSEIEEPDSEVYTIARACLSRESERLVTSLGGLGDDNLN